MTDEAVLEGAARVIGRKGPADFTLREVADEVGLAPATLLQRFGTKRGLLLALVADAPATLAREFEAARAAHDSPTAALLAALTSTLRRFERPQEMAHHLAFLQLDLTDKEFRTHTRKFFEQMRSELAALVRAAVNAGELRRATDADAVARALEVTYNGALITWAIHREGPLDGAVRGALDSVLAGARA